MYLRRLYILHGHWWYSIDAPWFIRIHVSMSSNNSLPYPNMCNWLRKNVGVESFKILMRLQLSLIIFLLLHLHLSHFFDSNFIGCLDYLQEPKIFNRIIGKNFHLHVEFWCLVNLDHIFHESSFLLKIVDKMIWRKTREKNLVQHLWMRLRQFSNRDGCSLIDSVFGQIVLL